MRRIIGRLLMCLVGDHLPQAHFRIKFIGRSAKKFRAWCGKLQISKCGRNVNIYPKAVLSPYLELGDNSDVGLRAQINGKVVIGNDVIMAPDCMIYTRNHRYDRTDIPIKYQGATDEDPVYIGDGCWIGARVIILPGVKIGEGAIIAAGAVVSKDIPPYAVARGVPARILKYRKESDRL